MAYIINDSLVLDSKYESIIDSSTLTDREKDLAKTIISNMIQRGLWVEGIDETIITTEIIVGFNLHRKNVYEEISDVLMNYSLNMIKLDANKIVDSIKR